MYVMIDQEEEGCFVSDTLQPLLDKAEEILDKAGCDKLEFNEPIFLKEKYQLSDSGFTFYIVNEKL